MKIEEAKLGQTVYVKGIITDIDKKEIFDLEIHTSENDFFVNSDDVFLKLDQPKPVVPQFVADWYEEHKFRLEVELLFLCWKINETYAEGDFEKWFENHNNPIQTLINMYQYSYTVEKEKLYNVKILGCTLFKMTSANHTKYKLVGENETPLESKCSGYKFEGELTEKEIKQADERLWQWTRDVTE